LKTGKTSRSILSTTGEHEEEAYYEVSAKPIFDEEGRIIRFVETFNRITEQVLLKRETKESVQRFQQFIDSAHDLILIKDLEGRYMVINPCAASLFQLEPRDFIGKTDKELFDPKLAYRLHTKDREVLENRRHICHEETLVLSGTKYHLNTIRFPLLDYKGDCNGLCSISRDITAQTQLQQSLIQSEKLAALGKLAAGVAHEINNPLSGILTFVEDLLIDVNTNNPVRRDYEVILREALRCRQIVKDLLDYARVQKPVRHPNDINIIVERVLSIVSNQAAFRNIEFDLKPLSSTKRANIDSSQMQQVILNLVMNAADAMDGRGTIGIFTGFNQEADEVCMTVSDHGCGIPEENLKKIYEPFFSTKGSKGNGLGLPVVLGIVERHGGKMDIKTAVGQGTTFQISLPAFNA
jgi:PAS domain S-box-containing protein